MNRTIFECLSKQFLTDNEIEFAELAPGTERRPDFRVRLGTQEVICEVKETNFRPPGHGAPITIGKVIREKIKDARHQLKSDVCANLPRVLVIFGTEPSSDIFCLSDCDFAFAIIGNPTFHVLRKRTPASTERLVKETRRNVTFRKDTNCQFSALARLERTFNGPSLTIYLNPFAEIPLNVNLLPVFLRVVGCLRLDQ